LALVNADDGSSASGDGSSGAPGGDQVCGVEAGVDCALLPAGSVNLETDNETETDGESSDAACTAGGELSDTNACTEPPEQSVSSCATSSRSTPMGGTRVRVIDVERFFSLDPDSCPLGFVLAWAKGDDPASNTPIEWNHLSGSLMIRGPSGLKRNYVAATQAISLAGDPLQLVSEGAPLFDVRGTAASGPWFDGTAFARLPTTLRSDFAATTDTRGSRITVISPSLTPPGVGTTFLSWWDNDGELHSRSLENDGCFARHRLEDISSGFTEAELGSPHGSLKITTSGGGVLGVIEEAADSRLTLRSLVSETSPSPGSALVFPLFEIADGSRTVLRFANNHPEQQVNVVLSAVCGARDP